jgi:tetratricopeptide (TPR) repeat protein
MSIFAGVAIWKIVAWIQSRQWWNFTAACVSLAALHFLLNIYSLEPFPIRMNDYMMLAKYYERNGSTAGSITTMRQAVNAFETAPAGDATLEEARRTALFHGRGKLARSYIKLGRWHDAKNQLEPLFISDNYDDILASMLALAYTNLGEKTRLATLAREMLNKYPDDSKWQSALQSAVSAR